MATQSPTMAPTSMPTPAPTLGPAPAPSPAPTNPPMWSGSNMKMTHYWDCNGQGCDATTLQPWDESKYISPVGYGPQDPAEFGGALYGEKMWLTGAASDALSALMGPDDGCCGGDPNDGGIGGCGKCALVQNPESMNPDWTAVVMKKNRCPPWSNGCGAGEPHFDIAAPGFDNLKWSTANVCGLRPGTGFDSQSQSEAVGNWWSECSHTADCAHLCDQLPMNFRKGCKLFASWGWKRGDPDKVKFKAIACPPEFVKHVGSLFGAGGASGAALLDLAADSSRSADAAAGSAPLSLRLDGQSKLAPTLLQVPSSATTDAEVLPHSVEQHLGVQEERSNPQPRASKGFLAKFHNLMQVMLKLDVASSSKPLAKEPEASVEL
uniref:Cellulase n=1 Tax=Alexandrium catenella TaxID=2925 RepID=A0A7S1QMJ7_ALECA